MTETGIYVFSKDVLMLQNDGTGSMHIYSCLSVALLSVHNVLLEARTRKKEEFHPVKMNVPYPKLHWLMTAVNISVLVSLISLDT
jgi:hypothetical protein